MKWLFRLCLVALFGLAWPPADAESLRCDGGSVEVGDSRLSVLYKCGEPLLADSYCAPLYQYGAPRFDLVPPPYAGMAAPCLVVSEWLYDRGPGYLTATVRIMSGRVQSITYGRTPP